MQKEILLELNLKITDLVCPGGQGVGDADHVVMAYLIQVQPEFFFACQPPSLTLPPHSLSALYTVSV